MRTRTIQALCLCISLLAYHCELIAQTSSRGAASSEAPAPNPAQVELEFWKSVERIGTHEAYSAYLGVYPNGAFAPLARAAVKKLSEQTAPNPVAAGVDSAAPSKVGGDVRAKLTQFSAPLETGSVELKVGDKFHGPGAITIGWIGAKKQLLIPNGEWVVLAAADHNSTHAFRVQLTSIALGQFEGARMKSMLLALFNRHPGPVNTTWPDIAQCEAERGTALFRHKEATPRLRQCLVVSSTSDNKRPTTPEDLWQSLRANLAGLGSELGSFNLETTFFFVDMRAAYLRITRYDCLGKRGDGATCPPNAPEVNATRALSPAAQERIDWARAYLPLAAAGFGREVVVDDLTPGAPPKTKPVSLPD